MSDSDSDDSEEEEESDDDEPDNGHTAASSDIPLPRIKASRVRRLQRLAKQLLAGLPPAGQADVARATPEGTRLLRVKLGLSSSQDLCAIDRQLYVAVLAKLGELLATQINRRLHSSVVMTSLGVLLRAVIYWVGSNPVPAGGCRLLAVFPFLSDADRTAVASSTAVVGPIPVALGSDGDYFLCSHYISSPWPRKLWDAPSIAVTAASSVGDSVQASPTTASASAAINILGLNLTVALGVLLCAPDFGAHLVRGQSRDHVLEGLCASAQADAGIRTDVDRFVAELLRLVRCELPSLALHHSDVDAEALVASTVTAFLLGYFSSTFELARFLKSAEQAPRSAVWFQRLPPDAEGAVAGCHEMLTRAGFTATLVESSRFVECFLNPARSKLVAEVSGWARNGHVIVRSAANAAHAPVEEEEDWLPARQPEHPSLRHESAGKAIVEAFNEDVFAAGSKRRGRGKRNVTDSALAPPLLRPGTWVGGQVAAKRACEFWDGLVGHLPGSDHDYDACPAGSACFAVLKVPPAHPVQPAVRWAGSGRDLLAAAHLHQLREPALSLLPLEHARYKLRWAEAVLGRFGTGSEVPGAGEQLWLPEVTDTGVRHWLACVRDKAEVVRESALFKIAAVGSDGSFSVGSNTLFGLHLGLDGWRGKHRDPAHTARFDAGRAKLQAARDALADPAQKTLLRQLSKQLDLSMDYWFGVHERGAIKSNIALEALALERPMRTRRHGLAFADNALASAPEMRRKLKGVSIRSDPVARARARQYISAVLDEQAAATLMRTDPIIKPWADTLRQLIGEAAGAIATTAAGAIATTEDSTGPEPNASASTLAAAVVGSTHHPAVAGGEANSGLLPATNPSLDDNVDAWAEVHQRHAGGGGGRSHGSLSRSPRVCGRRTLPLHPSPLTTAIQSQGLCR